MLKVYLTLLLIALLQIFVLAQTNEQKKWVGIAFMGDLQGERMQLMGSFGSFKIKGSNPSRSYRGIGDEDSTSFRKTIDEAIIKIKVRHHFGYKKIKLPIPPGFDKHLVFVRDRSLKKGQYFTSYWTDVYPFEDLDKPFMTDTTVHKLPVPKLKIELNNQPLTTDLLRDLNPFPGQALIFSIILESDSSSNSVAEFKSLQIIFAHGTAPIASATYKGEFALLVKWPSDFKIEEGSRMVFNVAYDYKRNGEVVETSVMSTNIEF